MKNATYGLLLAAALVVYPSGAGATTIEYQATHLGGNLWQYDYVITGGTFDAQQGFAVSFDGSLYEDLQAVLPSPLGWDVLLINPDTVLPSDGLYDALAQVDNPSFVGPFSVSFTWLGSAGAAPGSQAFEVYQSDDSGVLESIGGGVTTQREALPVPEPSVPSLLVAAVWGWMLRARRDRRPLAGNIHM